MTLEYALSCAAFGLGIGAALTAGHTIATEIRIERSRRRRIDEERRARYERGEGGRP